VVIVRRIFEEYNSGRSLYYIANALNTDRVKPRSVRGKGWRQTAVRNIIINPVYKGTLIINRHQHIANIARVDMSKAIVINVPAVVQENAWQSAQQRLVNNKHVRSVREHKWLLQGLLSCGLCGLNFKAEKSHNHRYYSCRGTMKYRHLDGSPRCTAGRIQANRLEEEVWQRIEGIINDPNTLQPLLKDTITNLQRREEELKARIQPIDDQLSRIAEQKSRLSDDWIQLNLDPGRFKETKKKLGDEESRLKSIRREVDPLN
jgi:site-specific DNA recombinase